MLILWHKHNLKHSKTTELDGYKKRTDELSVEAATNLFHQWIRDEEQKLRKDAVTRSMGVNLGKITEHLVPFSTHFNQFNPRDARFIGSPIDLIVFDGATEKKDEISIYFIEVKTGGSVLSPRQKKIKEAIDKQRIFWYPISMIDFKWDFQE